MDIQEECDIRTQNRLHGDFEFFNECLFLLSIGQHG